MPAEKLPGGAELLLLLENLSPLVDSCAVDCGRSVDIHLELARLQLSRKYISKLVQARRQSAIAYGSIAILERRWRSFIVHGG